MHFFLSKMYGRIFVTLGVYLKCIEYVKVEIFFQIFAKRNIFRKKKPIHIITFCPLNLFLGVRRNTAKDPFSENKKLH